MIPEHPGYVVSSRYIPTHEVDAAVHANEGTCHHVPDDAIVLDGEVAPSVTPERTRVTRRVTLRSHFDG